METGQVLRNEALASDLNYKFAKEGLKGNGTK
jgi:hypothetical protein